MIRRAVPAEAAGERLDRWLADQPEIETRANAERLVRDGHVLVDGAPAKRSLRLRGGEEVDFAAVPEAPRVTEPPPDVPVVYEDDDLLVADKPAGLVTHPAPGVHRATLVDALLGHGIAGGPDPERPGVVHRLDRDTTGLLVLAKSEDAHAALAQALRERLLERRYIALVHDQPRSRTGTIDAPLGRDHDDPGRMAIDGRRARPSVTHFEIAEALARHTLLDVRLETGRTHQIRVHLAAIGLSVVGDQVYGRPGGDELGLERQFLHAARLAFDHPVTGARVDVSSELPDDLQAALALARSA